MRDWFGHFFYSEISWIFVVLLGLTSALLGIALTRSGEEAAFTQEQLTITHGQIQELRNDLAVVRVALSESFSYYAIYTVAGDLSRQLEALERTPKAYSHTQLPWVSYEAAYLAESAKFSSVPETEMILPKLDRLEAYFAKNGVETSREWVAGLKNKFKENIEERNCKKYK